MSRARQGGEGGAELVKGRSCAEAVQGCSERSHSSRCCMETACQGGQGWGSGEPTLDWRGQQQSPPVCLAQGNWQCLPGGREGLRHWELSAPGKLGVTWKQVGSLGQCTFHRQAGSWFWRQKPSGSHAAVVSEGKVSSESSADRILNGDNQGG